MSQNLYNWATPHQKRIITGDLSSWTSSYALPYASFTRQEIEKIWETHKEYLRAVRGTETTKEPTSNEYGEIAP